jgi:hypothetical protein
VLIAVVSLTEGRSSNAATTLNAAAAIFLTRNSCSEHSGKVRNRGKATRTGQFAYTALCAV